MVMLESASEVVLILAPTGRDAVAAEQQLRAAGLDSAVCTGMPDLVSRLEAGAGVALVAEEAFAIGIPPVLRGWVAAQPPWSDFPFLFLTSQQISRRLHAYRLELVQVFGNVSLLERPLSAVSMISAVKAGLRARRRQYEVRGHLLAREQAAEHLEKLVHDRTGQLLETNKRLRAEVAERKQAETALQQAQKMEAVGQMTGGIAHDFNNLLTAVVGNLDLALRRVQDDKIRRWLSGALQAAQRGAKLTGQLLAFARKQRMQAEPTDLNALVSGMGDLLVRSIGATVRIDTSLQHGLWPAMVDPSQVELIILNLALNARDAMPEGGLLRIATTNSGHDDRTRPQALGLAGDFACVTVSDTGTGMPDEVRAKAFEPFFTTKPAGAGTGLGLSQVYGVTRQLGGHVDIESHVGKGTTIRLYFPRTAEAAGRQSDNDVGEELPSSGTASVLVVDDDADVRAFTVSCLESLGYRVRVADGGHTALAMLAEPESVDVLLIDVIMPEVQGPEVARLALAKRPQLRILFMTGYVAEAGEAISRQHVLSKPFTVIELAHKVREVLRAPEPLKLENVIPIRRKPNASSNAL
jgi:signal transduction histidine kinase/ActR/RegA family two-component response regulator